MSIRPVHGTDDTPGKRFFLDFREQWTGFLGRCNWYDFTLIRIEGEYAPYTGRAELSLGLLGFEAHFTYVYDDTFNKEMMSMRDQLIARIKAETGAEEVHDPTGGLDRIADELEEKRRE